MSSGFVSGGTNDEPVKRSDEWLAAQQEIEANRQRKAIEARQSEGKSLYETLEANKAAKQEAFEEANRLKNQFRSLDEDEVEFLDSVLESTRAEEERVKRETAEGLEQFRRHQEEADKKARRDSEGAQNAEEGSPTLEKEWVAGGRKRKRAKEKEVLKGVKIRRSSTTEQVVDPSIEAPSSSSPSSAKKPAETSKSVAPVQLLSKPSAPASAEKTPPAPAKTGLGLVDYGSDDDD